MTWSKSYKWNSLNGLSTILLALFSLPAVAIGLGDNTQLHGFVSQSLVHTSDNRMAGDSDDSIASELRELGLNLSWRPDPGWLLSAQILSRWAGKTDDGGVTLDYGFVDRTILSGDTRLGIQLGKVKNPYGLYNTTRDVAHTRSGVILPQSIYLDLMRDFVLAAPGASLYGGKDWSNSALTWQVSYFQPEVDDPDFTRFLIGTSKGHYAGKPSWLGQAILDWDGGRWRAGITLGNIAMKYHNVPGAGFNPAVGNYFEGRSNLDTAILSIEKNTEHWTYTAEYAQVAVDSKGFSPGNVLPFENDKTVEAYYAQAQWRFRPTWQAYARMDVLYLDKDDRDGTQISTAYPTITAHSRFARDLTLGIRHDIGNWALFAEVHKVDGTAWLSPFDNPAGTKRKWNALLLEASYRF